ncbi:MAG: hypothetical protein ACKV2Q_06890 [Planctomycetaceae bacterium]
MSSVNSMMRQCDFGKMPTDGHRARAGFWMRALRRFNTLAIDERMIEGLQLFDRCLSLMRDGITAKTSKT